MPNLLKLKMFICKLFTCWILHPRYRKLAWSFLYWFSYSDYVRFKKINYNVVSLGSSCLTRALAVATGIKPRRFYGEKSCPFDLYFSTDLKQTISFIDNDFEGFFENVNINKFPHDEKFNFLNFKKRYQKRIQNFLDIQNSEKKLYYIYSNYTTDVDSKDITRLYEVLKNKRQGKPFELILLTRKHLEVPNIIQIPYDFVADDGRSIEFIIDKYKIFNNKYTKFRDYMEVELKKVIN